MINDKNFCGTCVNMRESDGYCPRTGRYVNALDADKPCFVSREEVEETIAAAPKIVPKPKVKEPEPTPAPAPAPKTKVCHRCGKEYPLSYFPKHNKSKDGHDGVCRDCKAQQMTAAQEAREERRRKRIGEDIYGKPVPEGMRRCTKCQRVLPITEFGSNKKNKDGLQYECKDCRNEYGRRLYHSHYGGSEVPMRQRTLPEQKAGMTDAEMVEALRAHGWTVTCTRTVEEAI